MDYLIESLADEEGYRGFLRLHRHRLRHSLFGGGMGQPILRERLEGLRAVAVLPYDPLADQVVLVEQFRIAALEQGPGAWLLDIPGGVWEPGQDAETAARREVLEETGCALSGLVPIGDFWVSPGTSSERAQLYCGRVRAPQDGTVHGLAHEGEDIRVRVLSRTSALAALAGGHITAAPAVIGLQWLALHLDELKRHWSSGGTAENDNP